MGGRGSGGHNKLSDAEKKRRGTFRADSSEAVYAERQAAKVVVGPWLSEIPEPEYTLNAVGRKKYDELTGELFKQSKLTAVSVTRASLLALLHQKFDHLAANGKYPSAHDVAKFQSALRDLDIAQHAQVTAPGGAKNKFANCGFSNSRASPFRLRTPGKTRA